MADDTVSDITKTVKDAAYVAVGFGVLAFQRAQVRRRELEQQLEVQLDQCWDLLRQRRAKRQYGEDPDEAQARPASEVESYLQ